MPGFWARFLVIAVGLLIASGVLPGIELVGFPALFFAALVLGCVNAVIRPVVVLMTIPFTIVTLGLFLFVVNAAMLGLTAFLVPGFFVAGFWSALLGSVIVSITGMFASWYIGPKGTVDVLVIERN
ncbi:MAG: phage holin family protein [Deltaproteobacteria bacterium]|nr:phage holin family protein [Deltaproteobacteria bacterium]MBW2691937.1 phage holin family protein [Deltaproteobacteria bacterium]